MIDKGAKRFTLLCDTTLDHPGSYNTVVDIDLDAKSYDVDGRRAGKTGDDDGDRLELHRDAGTDVEGVPFALGETYYRSSGYWYWPGHQPPESPPDAACVMVLPRRGWGTPTSP
jgi:hypothetical protein